MFPLVTAEFRALQIGGGLRFCHCSFIVDNDYACADKFFCYGPAWTTERYVETLACTPPELQIKMVRALKYGLTNWPRGQTTDATSYFLHHDFDDGDIRCTAPVTAGLEAICAFHNLTSAAEIRAAAELASAAATV
jgi:hypothetical protein